MYEELDKKLQDKFTSLQINFNDLVKCYKRLEDEISELRLTKFVYFNEEECWTYNEEHPEDNYLESLVCPVVIRPKTLLKIEALANKEGNYLQELKYQIGMEAANIAASYVDRDNPDDCLSKQARDIASHIQQNLGGD